MHDPGRPAERIIPAYAGSTSVWPDAEWSKTDHPRIRGEHQPRGFRSAPGLGSSPHTRGALQVGPVGGGLGGIIPAYAGSTSRSVSQADIRADHPRIRGEHVSVERAVIKSAGSSPHTRGALRAAVGPIPVEVDHPRIRGEHIIGSIGMVIGWGSSPHTRGARRTPPASLW